MHEAISSTMPAIPVKKINLFINLLSMRFLPDCAAGSPAEPVGSIWAGVL
jgi:hypothetical protein